MSSGGSCPVCNGRVADDFGLVECPSCGAQLIVHVDGRVEYSGNQESSQVEEVDSVPAAEAEEEAEERLPIMDFPAEEDDSPLEEPHVANIQLPPELGGGVPSEQMFDGTEPDDEPPPAAYEPPKPGNSPDLSDLAAFANSPESGGREGPLRYNLQVTGIDTVDVRDAFREAITDRKFMWDTEQIVRSIRHGEVNIVNVPPGKAFMLITRLRNLPVKVKWEQHAITQP